MTKLRLTASAIREMARGMVPMLLEADKKEPTPEEIERAKEEWEKKRGIKKLEDQPGDVKREKVTQDTKPEAKGSADEEDESSEKTEAREKLRAVKKAYIDALNSASDSPDATSVGAVNPAKKAYYDARERMTKLGVKLGSPGSAGDLKAALERFSQISKKKSAEDDERSISDQAAREEKEIDPDVRAMHTNKVRAALLSIVQFNKSGKSASNADDAKTWASIAKAYNDARDEAEEAGIEFNHDRDWALSRGKPAPDLAVGSPSAQQPGSGKARKTPPQTKPITKSRPGGGGGGYVGSSIQAPALKPGRDMRAIPVSHLERIMQSRYEHERKLWDRGIRGHRTEDEPEHTEPFNAGSLLIHYLENMPAFAENPDDPQGPELPLEERGRLYNYGSMSEPLWVFVPRNPHMSKMVLSTVDRRGSKPAKPLDWRSIHELTAKQIERYESAGVPIDKRDKAKLGDEDKEKTWRPGGAGVTELPGAQNVKFRGDPQGKIDVEAGGHVPGAEKPVPGKGGSLPSREAQQMVAAADAAKRFSLPDPEGLNIKELEDLKARLAGSAPATWSDPNAAKEYNRQMKARRDALDLRRKGKDVEVPPEPMMPGRAAMPKERTPEMIAYEKRLNAAIEARMKGELPKSQPTAPTRSEQFDKMKRFDDAQLTKLNKIMRDLLQAQDAEEIGVVLTHAEAMKEIAQFVPVIEKHDKKWWASFKNLVQNEIVRRETSMNKQRNAPTKVKGERPIDDRTTYRASQPQIEKSPDVVGQPSYGKPVVKVGKDQGSGMKIPDDKPKPRFDDEGFSNKPRIREPSDVLKQGKKDDDENE